MSWRECDCDTELSYNNNIILYVTDVLINGELVMIALSIERFNVSVFESLV